MIGKVRHAWPEKKGFLLDRKNCGGEYIFIHFWQPVELTVGGKLYVTEPNAVIILDKDTPNRISCEDHDLIHDYVHIKNDNLPNILLDFQMQTDVVYYPQNCGFITDIVRKIEAETFENDKFCKEVSLNYLKILFALISRSLDKRPEGFVIDYKTESEFKNLRMMVFSNLERDWAISHMAEIVSLSVSRFYILYKAIFKTTPNQDLILARMDQAKRLLSQNRNIAILDVAQKCGYSNEFHFIRIFKKNVGLTPKKYALMQFSQGKTKH